MINYEYYIFVPEFIKTVVASKIYINSEKKEKNIGRYLFDLGIIFLRDYKSLP